MTSIFDPPASTTRTFNASDWLTAIDVQLAAPPEPPPIDESEIAIDNEQPAGEQIVDAAPVQARRRYRNTPWAILATCAAMIYMLLVVVAFDTPTWLLWFALTACALELLIWLLAAGRFNRL